MLRELGGILLLSIVLAFSYNAFSTHGLPLMRKETKKVVTSDSTLFQQLSLPQTKQIDTTTVVAPLHKHAMEHRDSIAKAFTKKDNGYSVISLDQVKRLLKEKRGVFVDAREPDEFDAGHLPGAINIPYLESENHFNQMMQIPQDTLIVVYCSSSECPLGRDLIDFMRGMDFKKVMLYDEGWEGWTKAGMDKKGALK
ncbi:MAG TPA: rhodanese-like domain-containing protein [Bacteroidota bacterium]|nr:rhodanese-like domain-containing protein [Bacteroidota bacterium]